MVHRGVEDFIGISLPIVGFILSIFTFWSLKALASGPVHAAMSRTGKKRGCTAIIWLLCGCVHLVLLSSAIIIFTWDALPNTKSSRTYQTGYLAGLAVYVLMLFANNFTFSVFVSKGSRKVCLAMAVTACLLSVADFVISLLITVGNRHRNDEGRHRLDYATVIFGVNMIWNFAIMSMLHLMDPGSPCGAGCIPFAACCLKMMTSHGERMKRRKSRSKQRKNRGGMGKPTAPMVAVDIITGSGAFPNDQMNMEMPTEGGQQGRSGRRGASSSDSYYSSGED